MEVILAEGKGLSSKLIKFFTKSNWTHVAMRYSPPDDGWLVHATIGGVQPEWWWYFASKKYVQVKQYRAKFDVADTALDKVILKFAHKQYDYLAFIGFGVYILVNWISKYLLKKDAIKINPFGSMDAFMCSEFTAEWLNECNRMDPSLKLKHFDPSLTAPTDIDVYLMSRPDLFMLIGAD